APRHRGRDLVEPLVLDPVHGEGATVADRLRGDDVLVGLRTVPRRGGTGGTATGGVTPGRLAARRRAGGGGGGRGTGGAGRERQQGHGRGESTWEHPRESSWAEVAGARPSPRGARRQPGSLPRHATPGNPA